MTRPHSAPRPLPPPENPEYSNASDQNASASPAKLRKGRLWLRRRAVTDGMRAGDQVFSPSRASAHRRRLRGERSSGPSILEQTWNQLYQDGIIANGGDPRYLENWYFAAWAYNTGDQTQRRANGTVIPPVPRTISAPIVVFQPRASDRHRPAASGSAPAVMPAGTNPGFLCWTTWQSREQRERLVQG